MASESTTHHASSPTRSRVLVTLSAVSLDRIHRWCGHSGRGLPTDGGYPAIAPVTESHGLIKTKPTKVGLEQGVSDGVSSWGRTDGCQRVLIAVDVSVCGGAELPDGSMPRIRLATVDRRSSTLTSPPTIPCTNPALVGFVLMSP